MSEWCVVCEETHGYHVVTGTGVPPLCGACRKVQELERAAIVAWLRHVHDLGDYGGKLDKHFRAGLEDVAAVIERGDHVKGKP